MLSPFAVLVSELLLNDSHMQRYVFALDLRDDPQLIAQYEAHHRDVWPGIVNSIRDAGITRLDIFRTGNRLCMLMEASDDFSFEKKAQMDEANPLVQDWEKLMWRFQQPLPWAANGEKWVLMEQIFELP